MLIIIFKRIFVAGILWIFYSVGCHADPLSTCLYNEHQSAVGRVMYSYKEQGIEDSVEGTAFLVTANGYMLTVNHVLQPLDQGKVIFESVKVRLGGAMSTPVDASIILRNESLDLALLKIPVSVDQSVPLSIGNSANTHVGDTLSGLGIPTGAQVTLIPTGTLTAEQTTVNGVPKVWWQTSLSLNHGESGGPIFGEGATVLAIAEASLDGAQSMSYVIPIQFAKSMIDMAGASIVGNVPCPPQPHAPAVSSVCQFTTGWHDYSPLATAAINTPCHDGAGDSGSIVSKTTVTGPELVFKCQFSRGVRSGTIIDFTMIPYAKPAPIGFPCTDGQGSFGVAIQ